MYYRTPHDQVIQMGLDEVDTKKEQQQKDEFDEVEVYCMDMNSCEPHNNWDRKSFSWAKKNLIKLAKEEIKYEH